MVSHCAKFSAPILEELKQHVDPTWKILDPFAGTGLVHSLANDTWGVEIEPEWASMHERTIVGDARALPFADDSFDAVVTSCCYGNRMADSHNAKDGSRRNTYKHSLGRDLTPGNAGAMQWGEAYRELHLVAWQEVRRVVKSTVILNVSDHIRKGKRQNVSAWHLGVFLNLGFELQDIVAIATKRLKFGANSDARVPAEYLFILKAA